MPSRKSSSATPLALKGPATPMPERLLSRITKFPVISLATTASTQPKDSAFISQQFSVKIKLFNRLAFRAMSPTDFRNVFAKLL
jgi:hypothetical protein